MRAVAAEVVRARMARWVLGEGPSESALGDVRLYAHQREALGRVERLLHEERGALLADDVGLGKTFVALAAARRADTPLVVAPAALRESWQLSAARAGVNIAFASVQSLSRAVPRGGPFDLVIVDEAHHLKSRATRRFDAAIALCRSARVLLMTATPVQNRLADLRTILSLFLGERAFALPEDALAHFVVRRTRDDLPEDAYVGLPRVEPVVTLPAVADGDCLDRIVALPPPLAPSDGGDGGVLLTFTLVRQWASSRAALRSALKRRLARAHAMEDALGDGRLPTAAELRSWCFADDVQQLAFPELVVRTGTIDPTRLLDRVRTHASAVRDLLAWLDTTTDPDEQRADALRALRHSHPGTRIVAFSEHADTVSALYRHLASAPGVAMLRHDGGRVAGGRISRRELIAQFGAGAAARSHARERVDLLLTTDLLSEGVNLQAASVVVHLDLAWNPARLEQRVGRLRRLGSASDAVFVYVMPPAAPAERLLRLERRLRVKLGVAASTIGVADSVLPGIASIGGDSDARREQRIASLLASWRRTEDDASDRDEDVCVAAVEGATTGVIACIRSELAARLVVIRDDRISDTRVDLLAMLEAATTHEVALDAVAPTAACERITRWLEERSVVDVVSLPEVRVARARRAVLRRVDRIVRRAPRHAQPRLAPFMRAARDAAGATLSAGAERVLGELALAPLGDDAWLHALREFAALHARRRVRERVAGLLIVYSPNAGSNSSRVIRRGS